MEAQLKAMNDSLDAQIKHAQKQKAELEALTRSMAKVALSKPVSAEIDAGIKDAKKAVERTADKKVVEKTTEDKSDDAPKGRRHVNFMRKLRVLLPGKTDKQYLTLLNEFQESAKELCYKWDDESKTVFAQFLVNEKELLEDVDETVKVLDA